MDSTVKLYSLSCNRAKTYGVAALFILGNIALPQLFHLIPQGGMMWLPIYFFTLIGAYKYGWQVGLLTAGASPLINSWLFGMPAAAVLPAVLMKSILLALIAGYVAHRYQRISIALLLAIVLGYQFIGTLGEWLLTGSWLVATQDFRMAVPGMLLQVVGGYFFISYLIRK